MEAFSFWIQLESYARQLELLLNDQQQQLATGNWQLANVCHWDLWGPRKSVESRSRQFSCLDLFTVVVVAVCGLLKRYNFVLIEIYWYFQARATSTWNPFLFAVQIVSSDDQMFGPESSDLWLANGHWSNMHQFACCLMGSQMRASSYGNCGKVVGAGQPIAFNWRSSRRV